MSKKWTAVLMTAGVLTLTAGCQPTTEAVIVIPKNAIAGAKMVDEEAVGDVPTQVKAPETCSLELKDTEGAVDIFVDADVNVPKVEGIRLKRVETRLFNQKDMDNIQEKLLQGKPLTERIYTTEQREFGIDMTRDEIMPVIEYYERKLKEISESKMQAEEDLTYYDNQIGHWYQRLDMAPERFEMKEVVPKVSYDKEAAELYQEVGEDLCVMNENTIYGSTVVDQRNYNFFLNNNWRSDMKQTGMYLTEGPYQRNLQGDFNGENMYVSYYDFVSSRGYEAKASTADDDAEEIETEVALDKFFPEEDPDQYGGWELESSQEEVQEQGDALVAKMGFEDMKAAAYKKGNRLDPNTFQEQYALEIVYLRELDGIPMTYVNCRYDYNTGQENDYAESLRVAYDDEGLVQMIWQNPSKVYDMSDEYVFLLPFSDILKIFKEEAIAANRDQEYYETYAEKKIIRIKDIRLGYMWVPDTATEMEGMLIPVWDFIGSSMQYWVDEKGFNVSDSVRMARDLSFLTINAMDGTVVRTALQNY